MRKAWLGYLILMTGCQFDHTWTFYQSPQSAISSSTMGRKASASTHIILVHGLDPLDWGNLQGLQTSLIQAGYSDTKLFQFYEISTIVREIAQLKVQSPQAKVLVAGYSAGAESAAIIANRLHDTHGIDLDCIFYLSGVTLINTEYHHPDFVPHIVNIRDSQFPLLGMELDNAENYWLTDTFHYHSPMHPKTLAILEQKLKELN